MRFPNVVVVVRPTGLDEYGNAANSFDLSTESATVGFYFQKAGSRLGVQMSDEAVLMPPDSDVRPSDRLRIDGVLFEVNGDPVFVRSPGKSVLTQVSVRPATS